jgi:hypothetical protein
MISDIRFKYFISNLFIFEYLIGCSQLNGKSLVIKKTSFFKLYTKSFDSLQ